MNRFNWPESFEESFEHYHLAKDLTNVAVMSDIHVPYHHRASLDEAINYYLQKGIDAIFLNGDVLDFYMLSKFQPDPTKRSIRDEIEAYKEFIRELKRVFPGVKIYHKLGNHEERYEKYLISHCAELLELDVMKFESILGTEELGVELIKDQRIVYIGKLPVLHGHEVNLKSAIVNPARSLFLKTYKSSMCGHLHKTSEHNEQSLDGKIISCWSTGHLADPHPRYARINRWNAGCARVEKDGDGNFEVINVRLLKNKLYTV
jgi:predicted phosphodiesterase